MMSGKHTLFKFVLSPQSYRHHKKKTKWARQVAWIIKIRNAYKLMVGKSEARSRGEMQITIEINYKK
jgi:hypothetical protein